MNLDLSTIAASSIFIGLIAGFWDSIKVWLKKLMALCIITTNNKDKIDPALGVKNGKGDMSTRPGRLDIILELGKMDKECRTEFANKILSECPDKIEKVVEEGEDFTPAQFAELCKGIALDYYWSNKEN